MEENCQSFGGRECWGEKKERGSDCALLNSLEVISSTGSSDMVISEVPGHYLFTVNSITHRVHSTNNSILAV